MNDPAIRQSTATTTDTPQGSVPPAAAARPVGHLGGIVAGSLATGLAAGVLLVFAPFIPADESGATGAILCGFALGWTMLAVLSVRFTDQPQRWAVAPALFMGICALLLIALGSTAQQVLTWVWPPALLALTIGLVLRVRRQLHSRGARVLLYPVIVFLMVASSGAGYETVREAIDAKNYPAAGELIDVGGHRMHINCTGNGAPGTPTVVLEPGAGEMSSSLGWITPAVARDARVCVYDRPGRGWSDPTDLPEDGNQIATDLHTLLHKANVPGPYVLAGHSFGGLYVLDFAARYPDEVAGMVLIDSTAPKAGNPSQFTVRSGSNEILSRASALVSISARLGLGRLYSLFAFGDLPPQSRDEVRATVSTASTLQSTIDEYVQASTSMEQAAALRDFGAKPLVVLTAGTGSADSWFANQDHLASLSTNTAHQVVNGASHEMLVADRAASASTIAAIRAVVTAVRSGTPLANQPGDSAGATN